MFELRLEWMRMMSDLAKDLVYYLGSYLDYYLTSSTADPSAKAH